MLEATHDHHPAAPKDPRWDSPLFSWWRDDHPDRVPHRSHNGTVGPGYPRAWEQCPSCVGVGLNPTRDAPCVFCHGTGALKHLARELAGHRCERCGHPYVVGQDGVWTTPEGVEIEPGPVTAQVLMEHPSMLPPKLAGLPRERRPARVHWSPCDEGCTHRGPLRLVREDGSQAPLDAPDAWEAGRLVRSNGDIHEVQAAYRILTVHHLNEDKGDCRWGNLAVLCQRCHLQVQGKVDMRRIWPWEHTEWMRPHAAWWYAWTYLGVSLGRLEVEQRMDELLALERQA